MPRSDVHNSFHWVPDEGFNEDKTAVIVNPTLTLRDIPEEVYEYQVNGKSPIGWVMGSYQVKTDKNTGITNATNGYSNDPDYIVKLLKRVVRGSLKTQKLVRQLPKMVIEDNPIYPGSM